MFFPPFDSEASKKCKNTEKKNFLIWSAPKSFWRYAVKLTFFTNFGIIFQGILNKKITPTKSGSLTTKFNFFCKEVEWSIYCC